MSVRTKLYDEKVDRHQNREIYQASCCKSCICFNSSMCISYCRDSIKDESFGRFVISILVSMSSCLISIYYLGLNKEERNFLLNKVGNVFGKIKPRSHN